ncbi:AH receptor-interacting protein-like [Oppia nitens]|uniref:AH receptor-interacting protein-like n=1 Tax=Oppia nitens TaxID=1686743 RepID=UPI0023DBE2E4|nr:AH receptor-interacting protein-like [Oppia nitens]
MKMSIDLISSRKILYPGSGHLPDFTDGTKVTFHFKTVKHSDDGTQEEQVIDESKKSGKPMELIIGKKFKLILWEEWIKHMRVNEVSQLVADKLLCTDYPFVSKCYRKFAKQTDSPHDSNEDQMPSHHCCGMAVKSGLGHKDLDDLVLHPSPLKFTIELLKVENPENYDKDVWQMSPQEMLDSIPKYRTEGNRLYTNGLYSEAAQLYSKSLSIVEQLLLREKPGDEDWKQLDDMKIPLLSNLSQCKLIEEEYYLVIDLTTQVLDREPNNTKALFRRSKGHQKVWNLLEAKHDLQRILTLDPSLEKTVKRELKIIQELEKNSYEKDMKLLKGKLFS